jgi:hypothetical protein
VPDKNEKSSKITIELSANLLKSAVFTVKVDGRNVILELNGDE